ncbi:DNA cytosine methyltransferase [Okeania sp.]|uniref:DNA cytosine methyltransferase n=1 Tax=Okeania sp. TaxID=3100323 RepID=UPI002B4B4BCA|nr:DNA cytosine methyltransferase [Okeania sp.]MEB3341105.1 DNA cytosine methyltransferase [Okeania sp.]
MRSQASPFKQGIFILKFFDRLTSKLEELLSVTHNFGVENENEKDIVAIWSNNKPQIIISIPPCQRYSICNKNGGEPKYSRNNLFRELIKIARVFEPEILIIENVPNTISQK